VTTATMLEHQQPGRVTVFGPDFPFAYDDWLSHPAGLGSVPQAAHGATVAVVPATLAKGLEFDAVVVVDPAAIVAAEPRGLHRLYVVLTRAVSTLVVLHRGDLPQPLVDAG